MVTLPGKEFVIYPCLLDDLKLYQNATCSRLPVILSLIVECLDVSKKVTAQGVGAEKQILKSSEMKLGPWLTQKRTLRLIF